MQRAEGQERCVALLVAMNVFLLGFLAELQVKVSKFFRHRVSVTAREASK